MIARRDKVPVMLLRSLVKSALCFALLLPMTSLVACGPKSDPKTASVKAHAMPPEGEWEGVYYSQTYGMLHLTKQGTTITGAWRTTAGDKWGELFGEVDGDVLRYSWKEHKIGQIGPNATTEGKGYFRYTVPKGNEAHEIQGEWGLGDDNAGNSWNALKQKNMEPDPKSVRPDELENRVGSGGWDDASQEADLGPQEKKEEKKEEGDETSESSDE